MSTEPSDEPDLGTARRVSIDELKVTTGPRIKEIDEDHVADLGESIELEGLIQPIVVTSSDHPKFSHEIVDGRHRLQALENLGVDELAVYAMPGDREYAVPTRKSEVDLNIQSMAANVLRREQTQAEEARFLKENIEERIISNFTEEELDELGQSVESNYANARVTPPLQLIDHLENIENDPDQWKFSDEHYEELRRIRSAVGIGEPKTEADHIRYYTDSPPDVIEAWENEEITKTYVGELRQIEQDDLRAHTLEKAKLEGVEGYSTRDLQEIKTIAQMEVPEVNQAIINESISDFQEAREMANSTSQGPDDEDASSTSSSSEQKNRDPYEEITEDQIQELQNLTEYFSDHYDVDTWEGLFESLLDDYDRIDFVISDLKNHRKYLEKREDLEGYDWESSVADRDDDLHKARPLESGPLHCYFHDCRDMVAEIDPNEVDLFVFSPPYFTQRETIPAEEWYEEDGQVDTREKLDQAYEDFLAEMKDLFETLHTHLAEGGHLIMVVSDIQAKIDDGKRMPRYDIPSDLSHLIRTEMNPAYPGDERLVYENTLIWEKDYGTGADHFINSGDPGDFRPNDTTERILVFRKGSRAATGFQYENPRDQFDDCLDSLWQISPDQEGPHPASYPVKLVKPLIQLYSAPGDMVADPMVGGGTTLKALWQLNQEFEDRIGYGWENFASEDYHDVNYWKQIYLSFMHTEVGESEVLSGLDRFKSPVSPS